MISIRKTTSLEITTFVLCQHSVSSACFSQTACKTEEQQQNKQFARNPLLAHTQQNIFVADPERIMNEILFRWLRMEITTWQVSF